MWAAHVLSGNIDQCPEYATFPTALPAPALRCKTVHLIRHAQGTHNAGEERAERQRHYEAKEEWSALRKEHGVAWHLLERVSGRTYWDPPLTHKGRRQAAALRNALRTTNVSFDAVYSSPFRRTLQTAMIGIPQVRGLVNPPPMAHHPPTTAHQ